MRKTVSPHTKNNFTQVWDCQSATDMSVALFCLMNEWQFIPFFEKWIKLVTKDVYVKSTKNTGFFGDMEFVFLTLFLFLFLISLCLSRYLLYYCYFQWRNIFSSIKVGALVFFHCTHLAKMKRVTCETMSIVLWLCGLWDWRTGQIVSLSAT